MLKKLTFGFVLLFAFKLLSAQDDCTQTLSKAQKLYDAGNIEQIPSMLAPCIENGFTAEEKQQAQKLIILSYLFDKNNYEAEKSMFDFLKKNPEYEITPSDQAEFIQLFNSYRTLPIVSIGITGGLNSSMIKVGKIFQTNGSKGDYSAPTPGFQLGLSLRIYLIDKIDLNIEGIFMQDAYRYVNADLSGGNIVTLDESRSNISIPLSAIYTPFHFKKINPYLRAGASFNYLLSSSASITRQQQLSVKPFTGPDLSMTDNRFKYQIQPLAGIGVTYNLSHSFIFFEVRYNYGFMSQTLLKTGTEAPNPDIVSLYHLSENDFSISHLSLNAGLHYKFYKPRKK